MPDKNYQFHPLEDRIFSYGELFGPFSCDICGDECWSILVSEEEREKLPEDRYEASCQAINMGVALCSEHLTSR